MTDLDSSWRDPELEAELAAERALPTASSTEREALFARVMHTVSAPPPPIGEASTTVKVAAGASALPEIIVGLALVGALAWMAASGGDETPPPAEAPAVAPASSTASQVSTTAERTEAGVQPATVVVEAPAAETPRPTPRRAAPSTPRPQPSALAAEQTLLEGARRALADGRTDAALTAVQRHARRFARGRLVEERELLRVQALVRAGRTAEARTHADRFRQRFPRSLLVEALDAVMEKKSADR